ncbi:5'-methylthioadenosine phosphorylase [Methanomassiliicoccales archaeon RumEn M1]|jgi:5'-methylthioadenosine phosphorylase|nr:5'-methylthioadenosine phosphorylase [Methanomassiliicoccales archaeon RumEn M1]
MAPRIGIIGGTGVYDPEIFEIKDKVVLSTPYGAPSDAVLVGEMNGVEVAFLSRHGSGHVYPPHRVNYRANIWAMKHLGVERIISPCAVGSLQEKFRPGELVIVDQFIDFTKGRDYTFYDGAKTVHISMADPFCKEMNALFASEARRLELPFHEGGTYICIEGPRFSTRAESRMFRSFADIIGMTLAPECQLAREAEICYTSLATITDYDVWADEPVDTATVLRTMAESVDRVRRLITATIDKIPEAQDKCECPHALKAAGA